MPQPKALLVLERPWYSLKNSPAQISVLPFFQGLERLDEDQLTVYHATFFDRSGFRKALAHLMGHSHESAILYIGSHGDGTHLAGETVLDAKLRMKTAAEAIKAHAENSKNIEGVIFSGCSLGLNGAEIESLFKGTRLRWAMAYAADVNWLDSMMLEMSVISTMAFLTKRRLNSARMTMESLAKAVGRFNPNCSFAIKENDGKEEVVFLRDAVRFWVRQQGQGNHAVPDISVEIAKIAWCKDGESAEQEGEDATA